MKTKIDQLYFDKAFEKRKNSAFYKLAYLANSKEFLKCLGLEKYYKKEKK